MRIISGIYGRRTLAAPKGLSTRPTSGRVREALFAHLESAILEHGFADLRVLDLFAGSGALGLEALSRGASFAVLVDRDPAAIAAVRANVSALDCRSQTSVVHGALPAALARLRVLGPFDLVFADPPYADMYTGRLLDDLVERSLVTADAHAVWESDSRSTAAPPDLWEVCSDRRHGDTRIRVLTVGAHERADTRTSGVTAPCEGGGGGTGGETAC